MKESRDNKKGEMFLWVCSDEKIRYSQKKLNMYLPPTLALTSNEPSHNLPALQIDKKGFSLNMLSMIDIIVKSWVGIDHQSTLHALSFCLNS